MMIERVSERRSGGEDSSPGPSILALVADLLFASRIRGVATMLGLPVATVGTPAALLNSARKERPALILIDLDARVGDAPALIRELKADPELCAIRVIAFGSHLEREVLLEARAAGADRVMARSAFVRELKDLLEGMDVADSPDR
jgi:CheY-like chemotaxis protein